METNIYPNENNQQIIMEKEQTLKQEFTENFNEWMDKSTSHGFPVTF
jgi:hypothetical protein